MTKTRKLQIAKDWWTETLKPYKTRDKKLNEIEDTEMRMDLMRRPFPTSVAAFKSHPLYVLEGDLLKFEAIYPESAPTLGYVHGKAIYSRDCVHIVSTIRITYLLFSTAYQRPCFTSSSLRHVSLF